MFNLHVNNAAILNFYRTESQAFGHGSRKKLFNCVKFSYDPRFPVTCALARDSRSTFFLRIFWKTLGHYTPPTFMFYNVWRFKWFLKFCSQLGCKHQENVKHANDSSASKPFNTFNKIKQIKTGQILCSQIPKMHNIKSSKGKLLIISQQQ